MTNKAQRKGRRKKSAPSGGHGSSNRVIAFDYRAKFLRDPTNASFLASRLKLEQDSVIQQVIEQLPAVLYPMLSGPAPFPRACADFPQSFPTRQAPLSAELGWMSFALLVNQAKLNHHLYERKRFECAILVDDLATASRAYDSAVAETGLSLWSIQSRLLLEDRARGLEGTREYLNELIDLPSLPKYLSNRLSIRMESTISTHTFDSINTELDRELRGGNVPPDFIEYIRFHIHPQNASPEIDFAKILYTDGLLPLVDRYESFVRISQLLACYADAHPNVRLRPAIARVYAIIMDDRLQHLWHVLHPSASFVPRDDEAALATIANHYTSGDYLTAGDLCRTAILSWPNKLNYYDLLVKSCLYGGYPLLNPFSERSIGRRLLDAIFDLYAGKSDWRAPIDTLGRLSALLDHFSIGPELTALIRGQHPSDPRAARPTIDHFFGQLSSARTALVYNSSKDAHAYLSRFGSAYGEQAATKLFVMCTSTDGAISPTDFPQYRAAKYAAMAAQRAGNHETAIELYNEILDRFKHGPIVKDASAGLFESHISLGAYAEALRFTVDTYVHRPQVFPVLRISVLILSYIESTDLAEQPITWPILHHIYYVEQLGERDHEHLFAPYENYLAARGAVRPSELNWMNAPEPRDLVVYFLRHVCIPEVMDFSAFAFDRTEQLENERISICQTLLVLDPAQEQVYMDEIKRLTERGMINKAIEHLDKSKIHIDTAGITSSLDSTFPERYERFRAYSQLSSAFRQTFQLVTAGDRGERLVLVIGDESVLQFALIFADLKSQFLYSNEFGLDSYLSVRIRHGTLSGQIRAQFEVEHLMTEKNASDGVYDKNIVWSEGTFRRYGREVEDAADRLMKDFSKTVDGIIERVRRNWIQIKGPDNNDAGLFDFTYTDEQLKLLARTFAQLQSYEDFIDAVFKELRQRTESNLNIVKQKMTTTLSEELTQALDQLADQVYALDPDLRYSAFESAITRSRTKIQNELEVIAGWFTSTEAAMPDFDVTLACSTAIAIIRNCSPTYEMHIDELLRPGVSCHGRFFAGLTDVMLILLNNAVKHSGGKSLLLRVSAVPIEDRVSIVVENKLADSVDMAAVRSAVSSLEGEIGSRRFTGVRREGRSGFEKLQKLLRYDLQQDENCRMSVSVSPESFFVVSIDLSYGRLSP